ncbi:MAG: DUF4157 domain-containing protein, partial [Enhygromyxa sp.]
MVPASLFPDPGRGLPEAIRPSAEPRLGVDLTSVRLHTDADSRALAHGLGAKAFALGNHVVFAFEPELGSESGRQLLAHELAHVEQQAHSGPIIQRSPLNPGISPQELNELGTPEATPTADP